MLATLRATIGILTKVRMGTARRMICVLSSPVYGVEMSNTPRVVLLVRCPSRSVRMPLLSLDSKRESKSVGPRVPCEGVVLVLLLFHSR